MRNSVQRFLFKALVPKSPFYKSFLFPTSVSQGLSLTHQFKFNFAKISKKKAEKLEKEKEKATNEVPSEIDFTEYEENLKNEIENYRKEIAKLRSGRLTPELFDTFLVKAYGEMTSISQLAQIVSRNATNVVLTVYDESLMGDIMKFLENSDMNFQLKKVDKTITCSITSGNTREIKEATIRTAKTILENYKGKFRKIRAMGMDYLKPFKKHTSEDVMKEAESEVQKIFVKQTAELEKVLKDKERELMK